MTAMRIVSRFKRILPRYSETEALLALERFEEADEQSLEFMLRKRSFYNRFFDRISTFFCHHSSAM